jgi:hypothetical protein
MKEKIQYVVEKAKEKLQVAVDWCGENSEGIISIGYMALIGVLGGYLIAAGSQAVKDNKSLTDATVNYLNSSAKQL